jgi:hypothetical protein
LEIPPINISACGNIVSPCSRYTKRFLPVEANNQIFFAQDGRFGRSGIVEIFNNLGVASAGTAISISNAYGFSEVTNAEKLIATNKGWVIQ